MNIDWSTLLCAVGIAFVLEGIPYFAFAEKMPKVLLTLASQRPKSLRYLGLTAIILGLLTVSLARSLG
ncbi:DUF2065 domain-containing protein [Desulfovibrio oxyclinae]|jgi:hypothetical protein|uniref:DUF2065 domain-containing protein n=1 Tax=Desulfovibrio oxyclinae TaxID=63560 RepID=UPI000369BEA7|nr:DUF2065 domain-containing protein [Desulfovibrio oxyclinae]